MIFSDLDTLSTLNLAPIFLSILSPVPTRGVTIGVVDVAAAEVVTEIGLLVVAEVATATVTAIEGEEGVASAVEVGEERDPHT